MRNIIIILILPLLLISAKDSGSDFVFDFSVDDFELDVLGNLYVIHDTELRKYNSDLKETANFSDLKYGSITLVDASDAMNLLVFYEDFAKVLFLDNTLSLKKSVISLSDLGFPNATLACLSYNNAFWIFDPVNQELVRITQFLELGDRSGNLNQIINDELMPDQLFESGDRVYLKDREKGVFIFDRYGGFIKRLPFINVDHIYLEDRYNLSYLKNDTLFTYNMQTLTEDTLSFSVPDLKKVAINPQHIYLLNQKGKLQVFSANKYNK